MKIQYFGAYAIKWCSPHINAIHPWYANFQEKNIKSWHQIFSILFMHLIMSKQDQNPTHPTQVINHPIGENRAKS